MQRSLAKASHGIAFRRLVAIYTGAVEKEVVRCLSFKHVVTPVRTIKRNLHRKALQQIWCRPIKPTLIYLIDFNFVIHGYSLIYVLTNGLGTCILNLYTEQKSSMHQWRRMYPAIKLFHLRGFTEAWTEWLLWSNLGYTLIPGQGQSNTPLHSFVALLHHDQCTPQLQSQHVLYMKKHKPPGPALAKSPVVSLSASV